MKDNILEMWVDIDGVVHQIIHRTGGDLAKAKIVKRGRLDILQDLTEQGADWKLEATPPLVKDEVIHWIEASAVGRHKDFNDIRNAIDWIIEHFCEKGI